MNSGNIKRVTVKHIITKRAQGTNIPLPEKIQRWSWNILYKRNQTQQIIVKQKKISYRFKQFFTDGQILYSPY